MLYWTVYFESDLAEKIRFARQSGIWGENC